MPCWIFRLRVPRCPDPRSPGSGSSNSLILAKSSIVSVVFFSLLQSVRFETVYILLTSRDECAMIAFAQLNDMAAERILISSLGTSVALLQSGFLWLSIGGSHPSVVAGSLGSEPGLSDEKGSVSETAQVGIRTIDGSFASCASTDRLGLVDVADSPRSRKDTTRRTLAALCRRSVAHGRSPACSLAHSSLYPNQLVCPHLLDLAKCQSLARCFH